MTAKEVTDLVEAIAQLEDLQERRNRFYQLCQLLAGGSKESVACLRPLLSDWDFEIRKEVAVWLDAFGIPLTKDEQRKMLFAAQQFDTLKYGFGEDEKNRRLLLQALKDRSPRVREKALRVFHLSDCQTPVETMIYWYGRGDYVTFLRFVKENQLIDEAIKLLKDGLCDRNNIPYHQRQCAFALQQLGVQVENFPESQKDRQHPAVERPMVQEENSVPQSPLQLFLDKLNQQGILTVNGIIYPEIYIGTVTGRITYRNPCPQNWTAEKRKAQIRPETGSVLYKFDFCQIEPRILFHYLIQNFWIALDEFDFSGDIYQMVGIQDREAAKRWLNRIINGGLPQLPDPNNNILQTFKQAVEDFRMEQMDLCRLEKRVTTISGREIPIDPSTTNFGGKVVNYLIQGSAADMFNEAVVALDAYLLLEHLPAKIILLIYDEVWVQINKQEQEKTVAKIKDFLDCVWKRFNLFVPVKVRAELIE